MKIFIIILQSMGLFGIALPAYATSYSPMDAVFILIWLIISFPVPILLGLFFIWCMYKLYKLSETTFGYYINVAEQQIWIKNKYITKSIVDEVANSHKFTHYTLALHGVEIFCNKESLAIRGETYELEELPIEPANTDK